MVDYAKAASDLKARIDAKIKRRKDLDAFFESLRLSIHSEVDKANLELTKNQVPTINIRQEGAQEPTIELACGSTICQISQDRGVPSVAASIRGANQFDPGAAKTVTFVILVDESPVTAQRVSLAPAVEKKIERDAIAATIVGALIQEAS